MHRELRVNWRDLPTQWPISKHYPLTTSKDDPDFKLELAKYRDLVLATLDYYLNNGIARIKTADFDSDAHYGSLRDQAVEHFRKGRLSKLRQCFRDLTDMQRETKDLEFEHYLKVRTGHNINIFQSYNSRIDKILARGKITTENQFRDVTLMVDSLSQAKPVDAIKIEALNTLLRNYEQGRLKRQ